MCVSVRTCIYTLRIQSERREGKKEQELHGRVCYEKGGISSYECFQRSVDASHKGADSEAKLLSALFMQQLDRKRPSRRLSLASRAAKLSKICLTQKGFHGESLGAHRL